MYILGLSLSAFFAICLGLNDVQTWKHVNLRAGQQVRLVSTPVNVSSKISWYVTIAGVEHGAGVCQLEMTPDNNVTAGGSNYTCINTLAHLDGIVSIQKDFGKITSYLELHHVTSNVTRVRSVPHTRPEDNRIWSITVVVEPSRPQCTWVTIGIIFTLTCTVTLNPGGICTLHEYNLDSGPGLWTFDVTYTHTTYKTQGLTHTTCVFHGKIIFPSSQHLRLTVSVAPNVTNYGYLKSMSTPIDVYVNNPTTSYDHVIYTTRRYTHVDYSDDQWERWKIMAVIFGVVGGVFILGLLIACCFRRRKNSQRSAVPVSVQFRRDRSVAQVNLPSIDTVDGLIYYRNRQMSDSPPPYNSVVDSNNEISTWSNAVAANNNTEVEEPPPPYPGK
ncbi:unnamed protein product [Lymnaea stagnalis]|uniref:Uncharacterized protein n=1 Tax=Lymnaea stagnalis TaxID=6523 RepID=A0AAV2H4P6_LYMST